MKITGKDLIALGFEQGPFLGRATGPAQAAWNERNKPNPREAHG